MGNNYSQNKNTEFLHSLAINCDCVLGKNDWQQEIMAVSFIQKENLSLK